jgi:hypothetical protein
VRGAALFCLACNRALSTKLSIVRRHNTSTRHEAALVTLNQNEKNNKHIQKEMEAYFEDHPSAEGSRLDQATLLWRYRVVRHMLGAGVAMERLPFLRPVLEAGNSLSARPPLPASRPLAVTICH